MANTEHRVKMFHAILAVTRLEEWCVEAKALLASGQGHRCNIGDRLHIEVDALLDCPGSK